MTTRRERMIDRLKKNPANTAKSCPIPSPGAQQTGVEVLTGVVLSSRRNWVARSAIQHLCFPPEYYPFNFGPKSRWMCACTALWVAYGILVHRYPGESEVLRPREAALGPEYWRWVEGTGSDAAERYWRQEPLWDWRASATPLSSVGGGGSA